MALKRAVLFGRPQNVCSLLAAGVFGDGFGSLGDSVLGQFTGQEKTDSGLDFSAGNGGPLVVVSQAGGLGSDSLKDVIDERVHDAHSLAGNTGVGVHLLQDFVDVDGIGFPPPPALFLVPSSLGLGLCNGFLSSFRSDFGWHVFRFGGKLQV